VQNGAFPVDQGERDPVQGRRADGGRGAEAVAGPLRRRLAGQRTQHVQLAGGLDHEPVSRPGNVRVFRPGRRRPGGEVAVEDRHRHQPHTVNVRHHAADQRRRGVHERGGAAALQEDGCAAVGRRLRRVCHAGGRDAHARGDASLRRRRRLRAPGRAAGRAAGQEKGDGRQSHAERRGQGDIRFGQLETEKGIAHDQHVRARTVRELRRDPVSGQQKRRHVPSTATAHSQRTAPYIALQ